jgi:hypothetical protein
MQLDEPPVKAYGSTNLTPRLGTGFWITGINDIQAYADQWAALKVAMSNTLRAVVAWEQLGTWFQHDESSTGQTFAGSGAWSTANYLTGLEYGPGDGYRKNATSGATYQVVVPAAWAGLTVDLFFIAVGSGNSTPASVVSFTLDGAAAGSLDLTAGNPSNVTLFGNVVDGITVKRFAIPDDGAQHTIVATAGTGGMSVPGWGPEKPRPWFPSNVARRGGDDGYTPNGSSAIIAEWKAEVDSVIAEFADLVQVFDIYTAIGTAAAMFADDLHADDLGHAAMCEEAERVMAASAIAALDLAYV